MTFLCAINQAHFNSDFVRLTSKFVIDSRKRISSAMDGKLKSISGAWIRFAVFGSGNPCRNDDLESIDYVI